MMGKAGPLLLSYNLNGRVTERISTLWKEVTLKYDPVGNLISKQIWDSLENINLTYEYDDLNQLIPK